MSVGADTLQGAGQGAAMGSTLGPYGALAGGIIGGAISFFGSQSAADEAKKVAAEQARRRDLEIQQKVGEATALMNASGVEASGSATQYLTAYTAELRRQAEWSAKAAQSGIDTRNTLSQIGLGVDIGKAVYGFAKDNNFWRGS